MKEHWKVWEPICGFKVYPKYHMDRVVDGYQGLYLFLHDINGNSQIMIDFPGFVCAYRNSEELVTLKTMKIAFSGASAKAISEWTFYIVENSSYVAQIAAESQDIYPATRMMHFAVISGTCLFEIVTDDYPHFSERRMGDLTEPDTGDTGGTVL